MSRKPIDQVTKGKKLPPRERVWKFIRGRKAAFTVRDISDNVKVDYGLSRPYLKSLVKAGYISIVNSAAPGEVIQYKFIKGPVAAPRVRRDGSPVTQGAGQENMWRSMKMLNAFSAQELALAASADNVTVSTGTARSYICMLAKAGYLKKTGDEPARWVLLSTKRTGPLAPMVQRIKHVYDPNLKKVVWPVSSVGDTPPRRGRSPSRNDARRPLGLASPKKGSEQGGTSHASGGTQAMSEERTIVPPSNKKGDKS